MVSHRLILWKLLKRGPISIRTLPIAAISVDLSGLLARFFGYFRVATFELNLANGNPVHWTRQGSAGEIKGTTQ